MNQYLIVGATMDDLPQLIERAVEAGLDIADVVWQPAEGGVLITGPQTSEELEAPYSAGLTPDWEPLLPSALRTHAGHLRDFEIAVRDGTQATKTQAQRAAEMEHVMADIIGYIRLTEDRL